MRRLASSAMILVSVDASVCFAQSQGLSEPQKEALVKIAAHIRSCGAEKELGNNPDDAGVMYIGAPVNVIWDVLHVDSVRAPYQGYIEFSTPRRLVISATGRAKHRPEYESLMLQGAWTQKHRYEFDLTASGVSLTRTLRLGQTNWIDEESKSYDEFARV